VHAKPVERAVERRVERLAVVIGRVVERHPNQPPPFDRLFDGADEHRALERLGDVSKRPELHRPDRVVELRRAGQEDHGHVDAAAPHLIEQVDPVDLGASSRR
jgi:hypothetical protein